jgi:hypothetical protein
MKCRRIGNPIFTWQSGLSLFISTLIIGVLPFLLVYYFCHGYGCNFMLWIFGIFIIILGLATISLSCTICCLYDCEYSPEENKSIITKKDVDHKTINTNSHDLA